MDFEAFPCMDDILVFTSIRHSDMCGDKPELGEVNQTSDDLSPWPGPHSSPTIVVLVDSYDL